MKKLILRLLALLIFVHGSAQSTDSLDVMIGQMIMIGLGDFSELDKRAPVFESIRKGRAGGVILFEKNLAAKKTKEKLKEIISHAQVQSAIPLFFSIDEEGGRVTRLKEKYGFPKTVSAQWLGTLNDPDTTLLYAGKTAGILHQLGINMNFAPSVDVNVNPQNPVIGKVGRSYSADYREVVRHAGAVVAAHDRYQVITVLKHFPGHGSSQNDTHLGLADVSDTWRFEELYPYKALIDSGQARAIMTAHIVNATLDERKLPATLSGKVINGMLRDFMGYDGVVVSDDMQMRAISAEYGTDEAIKKAIQAGVDILLFANNVPDYELITADEIHNMIRAFVKNGDISAGRIEASYRRIWRLKQHIGLTLPATSE